MWFFLFYRARQDGAVLLVRLSLLFRQFFLILHCDRDCDTLGMDTIKTSTVAL